MINLEPLADDTVTDRNFQLLQRLVLDTGGKSVSIRFGASTMAWAASTDSGSKTITHGLGKTPVFVAVFNADTTGSYAGIAAFTTSGVGATTFDTYGRTPSAITGTKAIYWLVIG